MEEARFSPSESGLQRKTELRSVHIFHQNAMPFAPCATQGPKETLFCSLRNAGLQKRLFFAPCATQGPKETLFCSLRNAGLRKRPFFAPCVTQGPKETLFCSMRNAGPRKRPFFAPCVTQGSERRCFPVRRKPKKSVQTVAARTLSSMLSLKSKILMPVASWSGHTCQRSQQPWRHRRLRLPRCRPQSAAYGSSVHRHSPA